jgi:hypothetical protein
MHSLDREEAIVASSSNPGEGMSKPEVNHNQSHEEENPFERSNPYMYNDVYFAKLINALIFTQFQPQAHSLVK